MIPGITGLKYSKGNNFFLIAGPCVVEDQSVVEETASELSKACDRYKVPLILKASYRKANRSRSDSFSGIGDKKALEILAASGSAYSIPLITDIHSPGEAEMAAEYVDILQIPAFLCRQTDILTAAARSGKWINIKKGQFLSGESMKYAIDKVLDAGNNKIMLTDRGNMFGYTDLVIDFRNISVMKQFKVPVITDITHSLQKPNQPGGVTGGDPEMIESMGRAAIAVGSDGIFMETHPDPAKALSDGANMLHLKLAGNLISKLTEIRKTINKIN